MSAEDRTTRHDRDLFGLLYETARNAGIEIIEDRINRKGGICRLKQRIVVLYDEQAPYRERNRLILDAISLVNRDYLYLPPRVRMLLEEDKAGQGS
ncbi:MAG: hypothetical protein WAR22_09200 [Desulfomonilia bacterium]|jgi:hypothetical protein